ncbi:unnamed protein product, partial [Iphiclides podalirius]
MATKHLHPTKAQPSTEVSRIMMVLCSKIAKHILEQTCTDDVAEPSTSFASMHIAEREDAKQSIIDTINSYDDFRFPSQGTNYADMSENVRIEDSVASEILNKTLKYEEQEFYRQYDLMNSHAGKIDNRTNCIIEHISDQLAHEYSLPEVSHILEVHMDAAEQRWRAGEYVPYALQESPPDSEAENETTLIPSHESTFEDTLTEEVRDNGDVDVNKEAELPQTSAIPEVGGKSPRVENQCGDSNIRTGTEHGIDSVVANENDEIFEDCVEYTESKLYRAREGVGEVFERSEETYTLEMKIALGDE